MKRRRRIFHKKEGSRLGIVYRLISRYIDPATSAISRAKQQEFEHGVQGELQHCSFDAGTDILGAESFSSTWTHFSQLSGNSSSKHLTGRMLLGSCDWMGRRGGLGLRGAAIASDGVGVVYFTVVVASNVGLAVGVEIDVGHKAEAKSFQNWPEGPA